MSQTTSGRRPRGRGKQRPCDFCRVRKIACIIESQPPCMKCQKSGRSCTFEKGPPPRGTGGLAGQAEIDSHPNMSLDALEIDSFDWPFNSYTPGLPESLEPMQGVFMPMNVSPGIGSPNATNLPFTITSPPSRNQVNQNRGINSQSNNASPASSSTSSRLESDFCSTYLGLTSETDPILRLRYRYDENGHFLSLLRGFLLLTSSPSAPSLMILTPKHVTAELANCIQPKPNSSILDNLSEHGDTLLKLFKRFIQPYYPVLTSDVNPNDTDKPLLAMVYSLALLWRSFDPDLPWVQFNSKPMTRQELPDQDKIHQFAWRGITREMHSPDYSTISACLLLMERKRSNMFIADTSFDTSLVATTKSLAFSLGLNIDCDDWNMDQEEKTKRKLLWWLVYVQDKWICIAQGQPPHIKADDFDVALWASPGDLPSLETTEARESITRSTETSVLFFHLLELTQILDDIYSSLFTLKKLKTLSTNPAATSGTLKQLQNRLMDWKTSFDHLAFLEASEEPDEAYGLGSLLVAYQYCHVLIHRTALRVYANDAQFSVYYEQATQFARQMLENFSEMKLSGFQSFWFSWSRAHFNAICDFVILLHVDAPTAAARSRAQEIVAKYRQWLWMRSKSFELVRMSLVRLDSLMKSDFGITST